MGTANTRLIFDAGANLPPLDEPSYHDPIEIEGLTCGRAAFDAVFISHHHHDHCGLLGGVLPDIPVWSGRETARICDVIADFTDGPKGRITHFFTGGSDCQPTIIGDMTVTPIGVDHSACDAYMFLIQADGKNVLYSGDYRAVEDVPEAVERLIGRAGKLDVLITEGTNICALQQTPNDKFAGALWDEGMVEDEAARLMEAHEGTIFVLCSSTNEPRIQAINAACQRTGRIACQDLFLTAVRESLAKSDACNVQSFVARGVRKARNPRVYRYFQHYYRQRALVGVYALAKQPQKQVIFVRTSMLKFMKTYLFARKGNDHLLIYAMWEGYKPTEPVQRLLGFCKTNEIKTISLHCSGHAYPHRIKRLIGRLQPAVVVPIHCHHADRGLFETIHPGCVMLQDGEPFTV